jgi:hypothetical protein
MIRAPSDPSLHKSVCNWGRWCVNDVLSCCSDEFRGAVRKGRSIGEKGTKPVESPQRAVGMQQEQPSIARLAVRRQILNARASRGARGPLRMPLKLHNVDRTWGWHPVIGCYWPTTTQRPRTMCLRKNAHGSIRLRVGTIRDTKRSVITRSLKTAK